MNPEQRKAKIDKLLKQSIKDDVSVPIHEDYPSEAVTTLSVDWTKANITHLQPSRVEELWNKAAKLLNTPGFIVHAAGNPSARQVTSVSAAASCDSSVPPHFVYAKKSGGDGTEVHCDCPVYSSTPKVCQHSLAAAEDMNILNDYLAFIRKIKTGGLNLSALISKELPKAAGQKSTSRRKGAPKGKKKCIVTETDALSMSSSTDGENVPPQFVSTMTLPSSTPFASPFSPNGHSHGTFQPPRINNAWSAFPLSRPPTYVIFCNTQSVICVFTNTQPIIYIFTDVQLVIHVFTNIQRIIRICLHQHLAKYIHQISPLFL